MKKYNLLLIASSLFFIVSCNSNEKGNSTSGTAKADTNLLNAPVTSDSNMIADALSVSEMEMKDDSVFADGSKPTSWENAGIADVKGLKLFLKQVQQWVMNNDKEKLASIVRYPLKGIKTEQEMLAAYDKVFTKEVKLSFATINFNQVFRNQQGVMIGNGKVWINQFGKDFKIFAIN